MLNMQYTYFKYNYLINSFRMLYNVFDHSHIHVPSPNSSCFIPPPSPPPTSVLFLIYIKPLKSKSILCCPCTPGYEAFHWNIDLPEAYPQRKWTPSWRSHQQTTPPQLGWGSQTPSSHARMLTGLMFYRSCWGSHGCHELMSVDDTLTSDFPNLWLLQSLHSPSLHGPGASRGGKWHKSPMNLHSENFD